MPLTELEAMRLQRNQLWELLDDIDTAMDVMKPDMTRSFNQWLSRHVEKRFRIYNPEDDDDQG